MSQHTDEVVPGLGVHDSHAEWDTCVIPYGEHECWRRFPHLHGRVHGCSCGFEWEPQEGDDW